MSEEKYIEMLEDGTLYNYITNLQEENQKLKEINEEHHKINGQLREDLIVMNNKNMELVKVIDEFKKYLEKNIEYSSDEEYGLQLTEKGDYFSQALDKLNELKGDKDVKIKTW